VIDEAEIERFVREDYPRIVNAVALVAGDLATAEDMVQEALARAWDGSKRLEIESLANWVAAVALNLSRSRWRRLTTERRTRHVGGPHTHDAGPSVEARVDVERALATLPPRQREVAVLRYLLGLSTREVATVLGVGEGTVKNSLSKARTALAAQLGLDDTERVDDAAAR
jgi:RNA polymerase sigma factor (sigma-70 family)